MLLKCLSESEWLHWWLFSQVSKCNFEAICLHLQKKLPKCQLFTYARTGYVRQIMSQYEILDTDTRPSAALEALRASACKTLRVSPRRCGGYPASHRLRDGLVPLAPNRG